MLNGLYKFTYLLTYLLTSGVVLLECKQYIIWNVFIKYYRIILYKCWKNSMAISDGSIFGVENRVWLISLLIIS